MLYELHLTVEPTTDINAWSNWCASIDAKPLDIRLAGGNPNNPRQIMFAYVFKADDPAGAAHNINQLVAFAEAEGFNVIRTKLEVPLDKSAEFKFPVYHECHVKALIFEGNVDDVVEAAHAQGWTASYNALFTHDDDLEKWYFTKREYTLDYLAAGRAFRDAFAELPQDGFNTLRMECETVVMDDNHELDEGWAV